MESTKIKYSRHTGWHSIQYRRYRVLWFVLILLGVGSAAEAGAPVPSRPYWTGLIEQATAWRDTVYVGGDVTKRGGRVMMDSTGDSGSGATSDSLAESKSNMSTGKRVALKLIAGTLGGMVGFAMVISSLPCFPDDYPDGYDPIFCKSAEAALRYGYPVGIAIGVSLVGPRDRPITSFIRPLVLSLGGSAVGLIGGIWLTNVDSEVFWPSIPVFPIVGATLASELWRKPPQARRFFFFLAPTLNGGLSAVTTLRF